MNCTQILLSLHNRDRYCRRRTGIHSSSRRSRADVINQARLGLRPVHCVSATHHYCQYSTYDVTFGVTLFPKFTRQVHLDFSLYVVCSCGACVIAPQLMNGKVKSRGDARMPFVRK